MDAIIASISLTSLLDLLGFTARKLHTAFSLFSICVWKNQLNNAKLLRIPERKP